MLSLKLFAFFGGPLVLDALLFRLPDGQLPNTEDAAEKCLEQAFRKGVRDLSAVVPQFMPVNRFSMMQLLELQQKFMQFDVERMAASGGAGADYQANIQKFFEQIDLSIGKASNESRTPQTIKFQQTAVEPRPEEQLLLAQGIVPDSLKQKLEFRRPEPKQHGTMIHATANDPTDGAAAP